MVLRYTSRGADMQVEFRSDDYVETRGFQLEFEFIERPQSEIRKDCVYHLTQREALVSSEIMLTQFPLLQLYGIDCTWVIYRPEESIG